MRGNARITQTAKYVPEKIVTNDDLSQIMETTDEWIYSRTGIKARHVVTTETTSDLCAAVATQLLAKSQYAATELDFIIVATMTPDYSTPSTACMVQAKIGASQALAFDISAACSGFVYALATAEKFIRSGQYQKGLVIGGETMSSVLDWSDRSTAVLFGDGAAGVLLENSPGESQFLGELLQADGERHLALTASARTNNSPFWEKQAPVEPYLKMDGRQIFDFALRNVSANILTLIGDNNVTPAEVDFVLAHQANTRILDSIAKKTKIPREKYLTNLAAYGNTSAASVSLLLHDSFESGELQLGSQQLIVLTGFGGGLTWASLLLSL